MNCKFSSTDSKNLVGIDSRVKEMLDLYLNEGLSSVRFVGICGMGGMGKTTLAEEIYKKISSNFETSIFIANIREETKNQRLENDREYRWVKIQPIWIFGLNG